MAEVTEAMVSAACRAYYDLHGNNCYEDCMRAALIAALAANQKAVFDIWRTSPYGEAVVAVNSDLG